MKRRNWLMAGVAGAAAGPGGGVARSRATRSLNQKRLTRHSEPAKGAQLCPFRIATDGAVACHHLKAANPFRSFKP